MLQLQSTHLMFTENRHLDGLPWTNMHLHWILLIRHSGNRGTSSEGASNLTLREGALIF